MQKNAYLVCLNESIQIIIELSLYISCIFIHFDLLALSRNECQEILYKSSSFFFIADLMKPIPPKKHAKKQPTEW